MLSLAGDELESVEQIQPGLIIPTGKRKGQAPASRASAAHSPSTRKGRPTPLGQAFAEHGRIAKTLHLLRVVDPVDGTPLQLRRPPREGLRPLRDPATVHLDEDDEGTGE
ncbi:hypothetical protein [Streptomyces yanii]|uniref:Transposase n=1 Tax=Streptomyces yanii TaxID=78510 RepID=A0ABV5R0J2_9ACTN